MVDETKQNGDTPDLASGELPVAPPAEPVASVLAPTDPQPVAAVKLAAAKPAIAVKPKPKAPQEPPKGPTDPPPPDDLKVPSYVTALKAGVPGAVETVSYWVGDWTVIVPADRLLEVVQFLRDDAATEFDYCSDVTATDWPPRAQRFDMIYCLYSIHLRHRIRVKVRAAEGEPVPSVTGLWPAANWLEREVYDQFGVNIVGHPDLRRILMPDDWQGHPQRKDYPLEGPGEYLMENPQDWLRLRNLSDEAEIE
jgi:NADH-quinone oxidoreductase subunit C